MLRLTGAVALVVASARRQAHERAEYSPGYLSLDYPMGDLPRNRGVCTDVVIRALRAGGWDLQRLIHEDMVSDFAAYPRNWGLARPDGNIDHRRVPNQICFFRRHGATLPIHRSEATRATWQAGDIVYWKLDDGLDHCGILSDGVNGEGWPLVIHNYGRCGEEDCLGSWEIVGHYRYPATPSPRGGADR